MALKQIGAAALLCMSLLAAAQTVYEGKDAKGKPVFTDQPRPGDKPVELQAPNTVPAANPVRRQPEPVVVDDYSAALSAAGSVPNEHVPVEVSISIEPALQPGHTWRLLLDGKIAAQGVGSTYRFDSLSRGQHTVSLEVIDESAMVLSNAEPISIFVQLQGGR